VKHYLRSMSSCAFLKPAQSGAQVEIDDLIQDLLVLPPGTDLHKHPLILNGSLVLQVTTSCGLFFLYI
jgi:hypothetical protein